MEETKKWWQSRTIQSGIALIIAGLAFFAVRFNIVDVAQLESASAVYPEVSSGIALIEAGQWFAGISIIAGALVIYFRQKATRLIS